MTTHRKHTEKDTFYFVTFTCHKWLPLIEKTSLYDYFISWSEQLSKRGVKTSAFVLMPNHVHFLFYVSNTCKDFNKQIGESKRFMAYEIVKRLKNKGELGLLKILEEGVQENEKKKGKNHQVFRLSFDAKEIKNALMLKEIVKYIHYNPLAGKWNLAEDYTKYPYSSAGYYELGENSLLNILDYRDVIEGSNLEQEFSESPLLDLSLMNQIMEEDNPEWE